MGPGRRVAHKGGPAVPPNRLRRPCHVALAGVVIPAARRPGLRGGVWAGRGSHPLSLPPGPAAGDGGGVPAQADNRLRPQSRPGPSGPNPGGLGGCLPALASSCAHCVRGRRSMPTCTGAMQASSAGWPRRSGRRPMSESSPSSWPPPTLLPSSGCSVPRRLGRGSPPCPIASMPRSSQWTSSETAFGCNLDSLRLASGAAAPGTEPPPELRGNVGIHGLWRHGATAIFDVHVTDTNAPYHRGQDPHKILAKQEKEKKDKYAEACLVRRRTFTPLMFAVDGLRGTEASAATKKLALPLSAKWKRTYSEVCCGFVRSRLLITLVQTTSLCFRGSRDPTAQANHAAWDSGVGLALY
jgi:hypothetical protein